MKRKTDALTGAALAAFALVMMVWVIPSQIQGSSEYSSIPPSFVANFTMALVGGLSLLLMGKALFFGKPEAGPVVTKSALRWLAFVVISLVVSGVIIQYLGFLAGGVLVVACYMVCMGEKRPLVILATACAAAGLCYFFMTYALNLA
jgi:glycerol uptake facilitator-like aquaporin